MIQEESGNRYMRHAFFLSSYARRCYPSTQSIASERWRLPLLQGMSSHYHALNTFPPVFMDNAGGVIVNPKGEIKGSAITGRASISFHTSSSIAQFFPLLPHIQYFFTI